MKQHALSAIFPPLPDDEFAELVSDIGKHGLRNPIVLFESQVLDGWNRYRACLKAHVNPLTTTFKGADPVAFVRAQNLLHRHLSASQRAAAVVALNDWAPRGANQHGASAPGADPKTNDQLAKEAGVGERTIRQAKVVEEQGSDELKDAVHKGEISVKAAAAEIAGKPEEKPKPPQTVPAYLYEALKKKHAELVGELETVDAITNGDTAKEMNLLRQLLKQAQDERDHKMRESAEKSKQIDRLTRELKKLGWTGFKK